jgi:hypothetical protein
MSDEPQDEFQCEELDLPPTKTVRLRRPGAPWIRRDSEEVIAAGVAIEPMLLLDGKAIDVDLARCKIWRSPKGGLDLIQIPEGRWAAGMFGSGRGYAVIWNGFPLWEVAPAQIVAHCHRDELRFPLGFELPTVEPITTPEEVTLVPAETPLREDQRFLVLGPRSGQPQIGGRAKKRLTRPQYDVVEALVKAGEKGLSLDELKTKSKHNGAREILARLRKDPDWAAVILMAGTPGGRYYVLT